MEKSTSTQKHSLTQNDRINLTAVCAICGPVKIYILNRRRYKTQRCMNSGKRDAIATRIRRRKENTEVINNYIRTHTCKRCGLWSADPKDFRFFEMHLPQKSKIAAIKNHIDPERLKIELERRDLFCKQCYPLICREVIDNIAAPPVKPFSTLF